VATLSVAGLQNSACNLAKMVTGPRSEL
jgi:hypothetical protein